MKRFAVILATVSATSAFPAGEVEKACKDAEGGGYRAIDNCIRAEYEEVDRNLNKLFSEVVADAKNHPNPKEVEISLRAAQRAWLIYRDKTCEMASWIESWVYAPGRRSGCMLTVTARRLEDLQEIKQCIRAEGFGGDCQLTQ